MPARVPAGPPLFRRGWTVRASSPSRSIASAGITRTTSAVPVGGVRDRIIWVVPHGRIAGCRTDPEPAYIDDRNPQLRAATHGVEYAVSNDAERRFRPLRCTNMGRQWMMRW